MFRAQERKALLVGQDAGATKPGRPGFIDAGLGGAVEDLGEALKRGLSTGGMTSEDLGREPARALLQHGELEGRDLVGRELVLVTRPGRVLLRDGLLDAAGLPKLRDQAAKRRGAHLIARRDLALPGALGEEGESFVKLDGREGHERGHSAKSATGGETERVRRQ